MTSNTPSQESLDSGKPIHATSEPSVFQIEDIAESLSGEEDMAKEQRNGAQLATWTYDDQAATIETEQEQKDEFPMIVWLRGDEPWYAEFDLDADAVMSRLGIKRSRLTQISGRELRVGRVRVDRYIRPIYRSTDVEAYLNWTRATASHQKSSSALKDAAQVLQSQGEQIASVVDNATQKFSLALKEGLLSDLETAAKRSVEALAQEVHQLCQSSQLLSQNLNQTILRSQELTATQLTAQDLRLDAVENAVTHLNLRVAETSDRCLKLLEHQTAMMQAISQLAEMMSHQGEELAKLTHSLVKTAPVSFRKPRVARPKIRTKSEESKTKQAVPSARLKQKRRSRTN